MLRVFNNDILNPDHFTVTLELVPGRQSTGRSIDIITGIAKDAFMDGRISAVSITDNPGGNPSLSPDVLGYEIFRHGMDVIVHFTCRDMNRAGMESRALQLSRMGMKNILALTGDYSGKGFGGQGAPVFDFDSVILTAMLHKLNERLLASGDPDGFFTGCAISPFKTTEAECEAQYRKLDRKLEAGASFVITQLGYDVNKFEELINLSPIKQKGIPLLASVYMLSPKSARAMNKGKVPGARVSDALFNTILDEWKTNNRDGLHKAIDRTAKLAVILKGMGYRGIHIGGIHRSFKAVGAILDKMSVIEKNWEEYLEEFKAGEDNNFRLYKQPCKSHCSLPLETKRESAHSSGSTTIAKNGYVNTLHDPAAKMDAVCKTIVEKNRKFDFASYFIFIRTKLQDRLFDHYPYRVLKKAHDLFFNRSSVMSPLYIAMAETLDKNNKGWLLKLFIEDPLKKMLLSCKGCGDCAIQHIAFQCPESGCPKHTRNGACGGSRDGFCEVNKDKKCVWVRAWNRLKHCNDEEKLSQEFVPPRMWELNNTSSWINFHLKRDHQKSEYK